MTILTVILSAILLIIFIPILLAKPKHSIASYLLLAIAIAFILDASSLQYTRTDDEYITFRVVENFVNGKGLVYNPGEKYWAITNTGWSIILSILPSAGFSLELGSRWFSLITALFCLWGVSQLANNLGGKKAAIIAPFLMLCTPFFHYWSTSGLETMAFCALCAWSLTLATTTQRFPYYALIAGIATWLRPEAPLIFITCFLLNFGSVQKNEWVKRSVFSAVIFLIFLTALYLFRYFYYGTMQAATTAAKVPTDFTNFTDGISVLATSLTSSPILFLGLLLCLPLLKSKRILMLFFVSLCGLFYYMWLGFDTMKHERLLAPFIPILITLLAAGVAEWKIEWRLNLTSYVKRLSVALTAGLFIISPYFMALGTAKTINAGLNNAHCKVAGYLAAHGSSVDNIAIQDAGIIGYYWQGNIIDLSGIFDPTIINIHKAFGQVSNNSQDLPEEELKEMNHLVADYVLNEVKPRYIILVYTFSEDGELVPSKHNHNLGSDPRFIAGYSHLNDYYYSPLYILKLYQNNNSI